MRLLILVPDPDFPEAWDWAFDIEADALRAAGITVEARPWTEAGSFADFDAVLPLVVWGYQFDPARWFALLDALERQSIRVVNPLPVLRWNTDKHYLVELGKAGVATIPTRRVDALDDAALVASRADFGDDVVIKPPISGGAYGTHRLAPGDPIPVEAMGRTMLVQPFLPAIQTEGEYSLLFFGGQFSHALVKRVREGEYRVQPHLGGTETPCNPPPGAIELAEVALAAAPAACVYARIDMIRQPDGQLAVIELELIEPALFLKQAPDGGRAFAAAIQSAVERSGK